LPIVPATTFPVWGDLIENLVRGALGVGPDAWNRGCEAVAAVDTAIVVAAILQRGEKISGPGGYLRSMTDNAGARSFTSDQC
jgi:replication initiation protein RepC